MRVRIFTVLLCVLSVFYNFAQEATELDSLINLFPARDQATEQRLVSQLIKQAPESVVTLSTLLVNMGRGDDSKAQYALSAIARATKTTDELSRVEEGFKQSLNSDVPLDGKVFLVEQLQYFGTDASIQTLLEQASVICEPAIQAIHEIHTQGSLNALLKANEEISGYCQQVILKSLAEYDDPRVVQALEMNISRGNEYLPDVALKGLVKFGSPKALPYIKEMSGSDRFKATHLMISLAENQLIKGDKNQIREIVDELLKNNPPEYVQAAAYKILCDLDPEQANEELVKDFRKADESRMLAITSVVGKYREVQLDPFFKQIDRVSPAVQINLLNAARERNYTQALSTVQALLRSPDPIVQKVAIRTISDLEQNESLDDLEPIILDPSSLDIAQTAGHEALRWIDSTNLDYLQRLYQQSQGSARVNLLNLFAEREMFALWNDIKPALSETDPAVRAAAYQAMPALSSGISIRELTTVAPLVNSPEELNQLRLALENKAVKADNPDEISIPLIETFGTSGRKLLTSILPGIGGQAALDYIKEGQDNQPILDWKGPEAVHDLFPLLGSFRKEAYASILRLIRHPKMTADQRTLHLRTLMEHTTSLEEKKEVLQAFRMAKTYNAFRYVSQYLSDSLLQLDAAHSLVTIALPPSGEDYGLTGEGVRNTLMTVDTIMDQSDDDYTKAFLDSYLAHIPVEDGFISLFNGIDLTGWQGLVGNPLTRDTMFLLEMHNAQSAANQKMKESWKVEDGKIVFFGDGFDNLCTEGIYRDFELLVDWKIEKKGDSGLYLRGSPQVQIWDPANEGDTIGSGGLFNNETHQSKPNLIADNPVGEWNTFRILMLDDKVTVYLNGIEVVDRVILENYWDRSIPIFREGQIELQAHTTPLQFRNLYIREITEVPVLSEQEAREGFVTLFDGVTLDGWIGNKVSYVAENGEIVIYPGLSGGGGNLYTEKEYSDFDLRFDFLLTPGANNGLGIHAPLEGDAAYLGKEIQILDNSSEIYAELQPYQYHGSVYGIIPADRGALNPVGQWNSMEVKATNNTFSVVVNGTRIVYGNVETASREGTMDGKDHPGIKKLNGHIGFLGHGSEVHFKNIRIRDLSVEEVSLPGNSNE